MLKLSVVVPVFNEAKTIEEVINRIRKADLPGLEKEIIIVDDLSTDGTREKLSIMDGQKNIKVLCHQKNRGKGAALRTAFKEITGDYVLIQDADLEYDPQEYMLLLSPLLEGRADVVYGSRFMGSFAHRVLFFWHYVGNRLLTLLSNMFTNLNLTDMETCYKAFRADILKKITLKEDRFGFEPEFTAKIAKLDLRIYEVGIGYYGRTYKEGKKISWKDGVRAVWCILKYNLLG